LFGLARNLIVRTEQTPIFEATTMSSATPSQTDLLRPAPHGLPSSSGRGWLPMVRQHGPTAIVFALLGSVFWMGHHTGWKLPALGSLTGATAAPDELWCGEHLVPEEICVECQPGLMPKGKPFGFCRTHGVAECVTCHPELAQVRAEPKLPAYDTAAALALVERPTNNSRNTLHERRVQFATAESVLKAGVRVNVASEQPMREVIRANGEIQFDPTRIAHLSPRSGGTVVQAFKIVGDHVNAGDVLAVVDVAAVGQAKSELLQAIVNRRLRQSTLDRVEAAGIGVAGAVVTEAKSALAEADVRVISARQALVNLGLEVPDEIEQEDPREISDDLRFLGIPRETLALLPTGNRSANLYAVRAPFEGMVVASESVIGEVVTAADVLYTVADPRRMWLTLAVRQEDARYLKRGLPVEFRTDNSGQQLSGEIAWVSPTIDPRTRTLEARVVLDNGDERFKDKAYGSGQILLREEPNAVTVPRSAVQAASDATFVFVRDKNFLADKSPKVFHVRQVRTGAADESSVEILAGVLPGEVIATEGSNVILAQLLRSNLGAGCGCHEPVAKPAKPLAAK